MDLYIPVVRVWNDVLPQGLHSSGSSPLLFLEIIYCDTAQVKADFFKNQQQQQKTPPKQQQQPTIKNSKTQNVQHDDYYVTWWYRNFWNLICELIHWNLRLECFVQLLLLELKTWMLCTVATFGTQYVNALLSCNLWNLRPECFAQQQLLELNMWMHCSAATFGT